MLLEDKIFYVIKALCFTGLGLIALAHVIVIFAAL